MRRTSVTIAAILFLGFSLAAVVPGAAVAQDDAVGADVAILDEEGVTRGTISVREFEDPFSGADPARPPEDGMRYVGLTVAFTAADDQTLEAKANSVLLHDVDGHLYQPTYVQRPADVLLPDLQSQEMAPGNRISGFIGYSLPEDAVVDEIIYTPETYRAVSIVNVRDATGPRAGEPVAYVADDGSQAQITLRIEDPYTGYEPGSTPDEGSRIVGLYVAVDNTGAQPFDADPTEMYLRAADGSLYWPTSVQRPAGFSEPDLRFVTMAPGNVISGFLGYVVPEAASIVGVDLWPSSSRRVEVADLGTGGQAPAADPVASPAPQATVSRETPPAPTAPDEPDASLTPEPSAGVAT
jgi:hypothetical protein